MVTKKQFNEGYDKKYSSKRKDEADTTSASLPLENTKVTDDIAYTLAQNKVETPTIDLGETPNVSQGYHPLEKAVVSGADALRQLAVKKYQDDLLKEQEKYNVNTERYNALKNNEDYAEKSSVSYAKDILEGKGEFDTVSRADVNYKTYENLMSDEERQNYNYLANTEGVESAGAYLRSLESTINQRETEKAIAEGQQKANENKGWASLESVITSPLKAKGYAENVIDYFSGKSLDENALYNLTSQKNTAIREQRSENLVNYWTEKAKNSDFDPEFIGQSVDFLYQTGMSMADFLYNAMITGGGSLAQSFGITTELSEIASLTLMSMNAAEDTIVEAKKNGLSDDRAVILGSISGAIEYVTEKMGYDALFDDGLLSDRSKFRYVVANILSEGTEEATSDVMNLVADEIFDQVTGENNSQIKRDIKTLTDNGWDKDEATSQVMNQWFKQTLLDFLGGALSGGAMAGGEIAIRSGLNTIGDTVRGNIITNNLTNDEKLYALYDLISEGENTNKASKSYELSQAIRNKVDEGAKVSNRSIGQLARENSMDTQRNVYGAEDILESLKDPKGITSDTVEEIRLNNNALSILAEETGIDISAITKPSEQREAIRTALNELASQRNEQNSAMQTNTPTEENSSQNGDFKSKYLNDAKARSDAKEERAKIIRNRIESNAKLYEEYNQPNRAEAYRSIIKDENGIAKESEFTRFYAMGLKGETNLTTSSKYLTNEEIRQSYKAGLDDAEIIAQKRSETAQKLDTETKTTAREYSRVEGKVGKITEIPKSVSQQTVSNLEKLAKAFGVNIEFATGEAWNGRYDVNTSTVYIDVSIDSNPIGVVIAHELTHRMQDIAEMSYDKYKRFVIDNYDRVFGKGKLEQKLGKTALLESGVSGNLKSRSAIEDEIICDFTEEMFSRLDVFKDFAKKDKAPSKSLLNTLKDIVSGKTTIKEILDIQKFYREASKIWNELYAESVETVSKKEVKLKSKGVEVKNETAINFSTKTWDLTDKNRIIVELQSITDGNGKPLYKLNDIRKWVNDVNSVAKYIVSDNTNLLYRSADNQNALKSDEEYIFTVDFSTLCAKRLLYQGTYNAIQHMLPNRAISPSDTLLIRYIMKDKGYEVPCGFCYVESRRKNVGKFAEVWFKESHAENYGIKLEDVTTTDGLENLRFSNPTAYDDFTTWMKGRGSANPKVVELRTEYGENSGILKLKDSQIETLKRIGGLRIQSFSDFEIPHIIDMMQVVIDMTRKGLTSQAYTKVPAFAKIFGGTGIKINLSVVADAVNGKLVFDDVEGMDHNEAFAIRKKYDKTCGTILVGKNEEQIRLAMADSRIDFIIPFHRSGWGEAEFRVLGLRGYVDFQAIQGECNVDYSPLAKKRRKASGFLFPEDYWDGSVSGNENTINYLNMCRELNRVPRFLCFAFNPRVAESFVKEYNNSHSSKIKVEDLLTPKGMAKLCNSQNQSKNYRQIAYDYLCYGLDNGMDIQDGFWKTLVDYRMYDNLGNFAPQEIVRPNFNMVEARKSMESYDGNPDTLPFAQDVADEFVNLVNSGSTSKYLKKLKDAERKLEKELSVKNSTKEERVKNAEDYFGTTKNFDQAGYITLNGNVLDFSGNKFGANSKTRTIDHREITDAIGKEYDQEWGYAGGMVRFLADGNIRLMAESGSIELTQAPNKDQISVLKDYIRHFNGEVIVDLDRFNGVDATDKFNIKVDMPVISIQYGKKTDATKIVNDIINYYDKGIVPKVSNLQEFRYSTKDKYAPTFYSKMTKEIQGIKQEKVSASSVIPYLVGKGVKKEEIKWSGIEAFLEGKRSVSKQELINFANSNELQIEEVVNTNLGENIKQTFLEKIETYYPSYYAVEFEDFLNDHGKFVYDDFKSEMDSLLDGNEITNRDYNELIEIGKEIEDAFKSATKWNDYLIAEGSNYREILFKLPNSTYSNTAMSTHWGEEGVIAHARVQDFTTADGKKMLFIEEIQSDWHNEGQKVGYKSDINQLRDRLHHYISEYNKRFYNFESKLAFEEQEGFSKLGKENPYEFVKGNLTFIKNNSINSGINMLKDEMERGIISKDTFDIAKEWIVEYKKINDVENEIANLTEENLVPDAPFKNSYTEFVLKRLLRMASEEGYDRLGWTTADQQSQRWSNQYAEGYRIEYDQEIPKFLNKYGRKWGGKVNKVSLQAKDWYLYVRDLGSVYAILNQLNWGINESNRTQYVYPTTEGFTIIKPETNERVLWRFGEYIPIQKKEEVWGFNISNEMKESVLYEGQPRFSAKDSEGNALTQAQEEFFKDSKARDKDGNLLVLYHGTYDFGFSKFNTPYVFFTDDLRVAKTYANSNAEVVNLTQESDMDDYWGMGSGIYKVYLNLQNPYIVDAKESWFDEIKVDWSDKLVSSLDIIDYAKSHNYDGVIINNVYDSSINGKAVDRARITNDYISFTPNQVKLTTNTNPTKSDDVRFSSKDSEGNTLTLGQQEYFKDSKVRDENGNLLVVYHGTPDGKFTVFDSSKSYFADGKSRGFFFTTNKDIVNKYYAVDNEYNNGNKQIYECYLNLINPLTVDAKGSAWNEIPIPNELENKNIYSYYNPLTKSTVYPKNASTDDFTKYAKANGYDGVIFNNVRDGSTKESPSNVYVAFNSSQIKLTSNTNPSENKDIRYSTKESDLVGHLEPFKEMSEENAKYFSQHKSIRLSKSEYAKVQNAVSQRNSIHLNSQVPAIIGVYTDTNFYVCETFGDNDFRALAKYDIDSYGDLIKGSNKDVRFSAKNIEDNKALGQQVQELTEKLNALNEVQKEFNKEKAKNFKLARELRVTEEVLPRERQVATILNEQIRKVGSTAKAKEYIQSLMTVTTNIMNGRGDWEEINAELTRISKGILQKAYSKESNGNANQLANILRTTKVKLDATARQELKNYSKSEYFGKLQLGNEGRAIDSFYEEIAGMYPEFTNGYQSNDYLGNLINLANQVAELRKPKSMFSNAEIEQFSKIMTGEILDAVISDRVKQLPPTYADKMTKAVEKAEYRRKEDIARLRKRMGDQIADLKSRNRDLRSENTRKMNRRQLLDSIQKRSKSLSDKLLHPTDKKHLPDGFNKAVAEVLSMINTSSTFDWDGKKRVEKGKGASTNNTAKWNYLLAEYQKFFADESSVDYVKDFNFVPMLESLTDAGNIPIMSMDNEQLQTVYNVVRSLEALISNTNKIFEENRYQTVSAFAEAIQSENGSKAQRLNFNAKHPLWATVNWLDKLVNIDSLTPQAFFYRLGESGELIFKMLRKAQDKQTILIDSAREFTKNALNGVDIRQLNEELHNIVLQSNESITLSTSQIMYLYKLSQRKQAQEHIYLGGIRADVVKNVGKYSSEKPKSSKVTYSDVEKIIGLLTNEQKAIADRLQKYWADGDLVQEANKTSLEVYNYEKFTEDNYVRILVDSSELQQSEIVKEATATISGRGMAKAVKPHAKQSVILKSIFDIHADYVNDMTLYASWLGAVENARRVMNFKFDNETMHNIVSSVLGKYGWNYWDSLLADINRGRQPNENTNNLQMLTGNMKAAAVGGNIRVIIQQPTAILRAMSEIDFKYIEKGVAKKGNWELVKKYSPIAVWKDWGNFDINTGRQMQDVILGTDSKLELAKQKLMEGAGKADSIAWSRLWNAVEFETQDLHPELEVGTDVYYKFVAERFGDIIDKTQVVDGILQRSALMRSTNAVTKMASSFMSEPTKTLNMVLNAIYDNKVGRKNTASLSSTLTAVVTSVIVNSIGQSLIDALRDDDRDQEYWEKFLEAYGQNLTEGLNPLSYIVWIKDIMSIAQGYTVTRMDMDSVQKLYNTIKSLINSNSKSTATKILDLLGAVGTLLGVSVASLRRDIQAVVETILQGSGSYVLDYNVQKFFYNINSSTARSKMYDILYNAYKNDRNAYGIIYRDMIKNGVSEDSLKSAIKNRQKKELE